MATDKPRILLTVEKDILERIDDYRYGNRIPSRSEAIRRLIIDSLKRYENNANATK